MINIRRFVNTALNRVWEIMSARSITKVTGWRSFSDPDEGSVNETSFLSLQRWTYTFLWYYHTTLQSKYFFFFIIKLLVGLITPFLSVEIIATLKQVYRKYFYAVNLLTTIVGENHISVLIYKMRWQVKPSFKDYLAFVFSLIK